MPMQPPSGRLDNKQTLALGSRARQMCLDFPEFVVVGVVGEHEVEKIGIWGSGAMNDLGPT